MIEKTLSFRGRPIYIDCETNRAADTIWCAVTIKGTDTKVWTSPEGLQEYIGDDDVYAHNGIGFDYPVLKRCWGITLKRKQCKDTLILSRLYNPVIDGGHSLKAWGIRLGGDEKIDFTDFDAGLSEEMITYCIRDTQLLQKLHKHLMFEMKAFSQQSIDLEHNIAIEIQKQEKYGFLLNMQDAVSLLASLKNRMSTIEEGLQEIFPPIVTERWSEKTGKQLKDKVEVFNVGSRQQIASRLESLGVVWKQFTENGNKVVNEVTLSEIDLPEAKEVAEYLTLQKRVGLVEAWIDNADAKNRVHGRVITNGAVTGRCTHSNPNMGQVPAVGSPYGKECRSLWTVPDDSLLVGVDLSGIELRCLAHYMQDDEWTKELLEGDIHTKNQLAAGLPERSMAKTMIYATLYGAGPAKIGSIVGGGGKEGGVILDNFYTNTPKLQELIDRVSRIAEKGHIPGLDGRRVIVRSAHSVLNTLLQSCGAVIAKEWVCETHRGLHRAGISRYVNQVAFVHDEIQLEAKKQYAEQVAKIAVEAAAVAGKTLKFRVPVDAEAKIGRNWAECH
jgi:DNA polymerase I